MDIKQYLSRLYRLHQLIDAEIEELDHLRSLSTSIKAPDYTKDLVQSDRAGDSVGKFVAKIVDLEADIMQNKQQYLRFEAEVRELIDSVENDTHRLILLKRHVLFKRWEDIAAELNYELRWIYRLHASAISNFENKPSQCTLDK